MEEEKTDKELLEEIKKDFIELKDDENLMENLYKVNVKTKLLYSFNYEIYCEFRKWYIEDFAKKIVEKEDFLYKLLCGDDNGKKYLKFKEEKRAKEIEEIIEKENKRRIEKQKVIDDKKKEDDDKKKEDYLWKVKK
jgi:hypothetical protein